jgi:protein-S-isoprenylcysteine O-methyltransferase Ste14
MYKLIDFAHMTLAGRIVLACWVVFAFVWIAASFFAKRAAKRSGWWLGWISVVAGALLMWRQAFRTLRPGAVLWHYTPAVGLVADALAVTGVIVAVWARAVLAGNWSPDVAVKEQHELVQRGPYGVVRHPIYSGVLLMVLGTVILWGQAQGPIAVALIAIGLRIKAAGEERLLAEHFSASYARYRARVRAAIIPFVI